MEGPSFSFDALFPNIIICLSKVANKVNSVFQNIFARIPQFLSAAEEVLFCIKPGKNFSNLFRITCFEG
jgi:hypothetical protein